MITLDQSEAGSWQHATTINPDDTSEELINIPDTQSQRREGYRGVATERPVQIFVRIHELISSLAAEA